MILYLTLNFSAKAGRGKKRKIALNGFKK